MSSNNPVITQILSDPYLDYITLEWDISPTLTRQIEIIRIEPYVFDVSIHDIDHEYVLVQGYLQGNAYSIERVLALITDYSEYIKRVQAEFMNRDEILMITV